MGSTTFHRYEPHTSMRAIALTFACLALGCSSTPDFGNDLDASDVATLMGAETLEILALDPEPPSPEDREGRDRFHGYGVRGRAALTEAAERERLLDLFAESCRANDTMVAACFNPRHGLRAEHDGHVIDLVVCFECLSYQVFRDGEHAANELLAQEQEPAITAIYVAAGLSIAGQ